MNDGMHLKVAVDVNENIFRFEIAVDEVHVLHVLEAQHDLGGIESTLLLTASRHAVVNRLMDTLKPHSNVQYTVIGTLAVDG